jgi:cell division protein FtsB
LATIKNRRKPGKRCVLKRLQQHQRRNDMGWFSNWFTSNRDLSRQLTLLELKIMATLADIAANIAAIGTSVDGLTADIAALNQKILDLQTGGGIPPALQAQIDDIAASSTALASKISDLDALTPAA